MADRLQGYAPFGLGPYRGAKTPVQSDTVDDPNGVAQAIICTGNAGNVSFVTEEGDTVTLAIGVGWKEGQAWRIRRVRSTNTTATGLLLLYV